MLNRRLIVVLAALGAVGGVLAVLLIAGEWLADFSFRGLLFPGNPWKLAATLLVLAVAMFCTFVLVRMFLEDVGVLKSDEQWQDWREDLQDPPGDGQPEGPALLDSSPSKEDVAWPSGTRLRKERRPVPKINWRFFDD